MTLESIYYMSQTLASVGVVISIIYLAIQLKQNAKDSRSRAACLTSTELRNMLAMLATDDSLGEVFNKAAVSDKLLDLERLQWYTIIGNAMRIFENSYELMQKGDLNMSYWKGLESMFIDLTNMKAFDDFWSDRKHWYRDEFRAFVKEGIILKASPKEISPPGDYISYHD